MKIFVVYYIRIQAKKEVVMEFTRIGNYLNADKKNNQFTIYPVSYYKDAFDAKFAMDLHSHPYIEIMFCKTGKFTVSIPVNNNKQDPVYKKVPIMANQFILLDSGVVHGIVCDDKTVIYNVEWLICPSKDNDSLVKINACEFFDQMNGLRAFAKSQTPYATSSDTENLDYYLSRYIDVLHDTDNDLITKQCKSAAGLIQVLTEINACLINSKPECVVYIKKAKEYISANFAKHITVDEIAEYAGTHKVYLQRLYKDAYGTSIMKSINKIRIDKCKKMLVDTTLTLDDICEHVGYSNRHQLIYEFKSVTGTTPTDYRNMYLNRIYRKNNTINYQSVDINGRPIT